MKQALILALNAADATLTLNSPAILCDQLFQISVQGVFSGNSAGAMKLQFSNDIVNPRNPLAAPTHWNDVPSATVSITTAGSYAIPKTEICYQFVRVVFTPSGSTPGTATVTCKVNGI